MKVVYKEGYKLLQAEDPREEILCNWFSSDIEFDEFFFDYLIKLKSGAYTQESPMIGNSHTVYSSGDKLVVFKSKIIENDEVVKHVYEIGILDTLIGLIDVSN